jgi:predicted TIM-barrel fold metal-dependent hydrolase
MPDSNTARSIADVVAALPLLDHHCHGVLQTDLSDERFEALIDESSEPAAPGTTRWDTPVGLAVRRHCAPLLDLEPFAAPAAYLARRRELGAAEVNRRLLRAAGTQGLLLDTGYRSDEIASPTTMAEIVGVPTWEVVRLEALAEEVAQSGVTAKRYPAAFEEALAARAEHAIGLKTILAYRGGFGIDPTPPGHGDVVEGAGRWLAAVERGTARLTEPAILRYGIWAGAKLARDCRLPLQIHVGYGDPDLTLHLTNPTLLTDLLRGLGRLGVNVTLLHCYPYHREAAYLADMLPNVYLDLGLALTFAGASAGRIVAETMEVAPFTKQLYSSDGFGVAELHYLGAAHFRAGLGRVLADWIADGACTLADATRIASAIAFGNARRIYSVGSRQ